MLGALRYMALGEGRKGVLAGSDGWLFTTEEVRPLTDDLDRSLARIDRVRDRLAALYRRQGGAVALISGRDVADLRGHMDGFEGIVAGSHGAELSLRPGRIQTLHRVDFDAGPLHAAAHAAAAPHPDESPAR